MYKYYEIKYGNASSSVITLCAFGNDPFFMQLVKGSDKLIVQVGVIFQNI